MKSIRQNRFERLDLNGLNHTTETKILASKKKKRKLRRKINCKCLNASEFQLQGEREREIIESKRS